MHEDYNNSTEKVSYSIYEREIKKMNISFTKQGSEECEDGDTHETHMHKLDTPANGEYIYPQFCETCLNFNKHKDSVESIHTENQKEIKHLSEGSEESSCNAQDAWL